MINVSRLIKRLDVPVNMIPKSIINMCYQGNEFVKANLIIGSLINGCIDKCRKHLESSKNYEEFQSLIEGPINDILKALHDSDCYDHKDTPDIKTILTAHTMGTTGYVPNIYNMPKGVVSNDDKSEGIRLEALRLIVGAGYCLMKGSSPEGFVGGFTPEGFTED
jgi:hypothetical protein